MLLIKEYSGLERMGSKCNEFRQLSEFGDRTTKSNSYKKVSCLHIANCLRRSGQLESFTELLITAEILFKLLNNLILKIHQ